jgi:hypothetical protein
MRFDFCLLSMTYTRTHVECHLTAIGHNISRQPFQAEDGTPQPAVLPASPGGPASVLLASPTKRPVVFVLVGLAARRRRLRPAAGDRSPGSW